MCLLILLSACNKSTSKAKPEPPAKPLNHLGGNKSYFSSPEKTFETFKAAVVMWNTTVMANCMAYEFGKSRAGDETILYGLDDKQAELKACFLQFKFVGYEPKNGARLITYTYSGCDNYKGGKMVMMADSSWRIVSF